MQSFRTELENPVVEKDIIALAAKIHEYQGGKLDEDKFRSLRLARGIYGQRQPGVQMVRIKLPYGKVTSQQLRRICDVSEEYSTGRLHIHTRQDIRSEKDIIALAAKIHEYQGGKLDEDKFRSLRLARGIYGQRQPGVQMVRIKLPYGKVTSQQLRRICDVSEEYSTGRLHITTRQDI